MDARQSGIIRCLLLLALILALTGCVKAKLHRPENIERQDDYALAFIEFDDHGEPWAPSQLERTVELIEQSNHKGRTLTLLFVHGWHNDASKREDRKRDNNVEGFQRLLGEIRELMSRQEHTDDISLIGVYLSWRGRSTDVKLIKPLSFYSRRGAGQRAAGVSTTEAILRVMGATKENPRSAGIVIGHSFGGMIVERAMSQALVGYATNRTSNIEPMADMILLVNPASQSMNAKHMVSMLQRNRLKYYREDAEGNRVEEPFIVSVTSTGDTATGDLYPFALGLKGWTKGFREYEPTDCSPAPNQKVFYKKTAGHNTVLHSHAITTGDPIEPGSVDDKTMVLEESLDPQTGEKRYSFPGKEYMFMIRRLPWSYNDTPYWIMSVPPELIRTHSDIFTYNTIQMIRALLRMSGVMQPGNSVLVREDGVRPVELISLPDGGIAFLELSRRFYLLGETNRRPLALACLPPVILPGTVIGVSYEGERAHVIASAEFSDGKKTKIHTDLVSFDFSVAGSAGLVWTEIQSDLQFTAGALDPQQAVLYLTRAGEFYVADLTMKKPRPELKSRFDEAITIDRMRVDQAGNRLMAIDREAGNFYRIDLSADAPLPELVASDLGLLVDLDVSEDEPNLIVDAAGKRVIQIDCSHGASCAAPETFAKIQEFQRPVTVVRTVDDTVWVGDFEAQSLFEFNADGDVIKVLRSMSGFDE
jgi:pimeloyl-ACP methyl ester carboxylesterase